MQTFSSSLILVFLEALLLSTNVYQKQLRISSPSRKVVPDFFMYACYRHTVSKTEHSTTTAIMFYHTAPHIKATFLIITIQLPRHGRSYSTVAIHQLYSSHLGTTKTGPDETNMLGYSSMYQWSLIYRHVVEREKNVGNFFSPKRRCFFSPSCLLRELEIITFKNKVILLNKVQKTHT